LAGVGGSVNIMPDMADGGLTVGLPAHIRSRMVAALQQQRAYVLYCIHGSSRTPGRQAVRPAGKQAATTGQASRQESKQAGQQYRQGPWTTPLKAVLGFCGRGCLQASVVDQTCTLETHNMPGMLVIVIPSTTINAQPVYSAMQLSQCSLLAVHSTRAL
jgi:hypothetical protein